MKSALFALTLALLVPTFAQAKLTVFSNEEAARLVLSSSSMDKAKKLSNADTFLSLSVEKERFNTFNVTLELSKQDSRCFVNVEVVAQGEGLGRPGSVATNKLIVKSITAEKCIN